MRYYFAPLEGITGYIFRNVYEKHYGGLDAYYSPFVVTRDGGVMKQKELKDILPENNKTVNLIPQILTNHSENFLQAAGQMTELGYKEVNLNVGCPSGTVVGKGRGAGFLKNLDALDRFLYEIFDGAQCEVSVKTRIGVWETDEFFEILEIYNKYPIKELIIHPRTRKEFYKGEPHIDSFRYGYRKSKNPVCYNGDLRSFEDIVQKEKEFPNLHAVMAGRGLLARPGFMSHKKPFASVEEEKKRLQLFIDELTLAYREVLSGDTHLLHKMKELWIHIAPQFEDSEKYLKKIKKANKFEQYQETIERLFAEKQLVTSK